MTLRDRRHDGQLTDDDKLKIAELSLLEDQFMSFLRGLGGSREVSKAVTELEDAVMWAERHIRRRV